MKSDTVHIGVDVSKEKLDIYVPAKKEGSRPLTKEVDNNINGFRELRDLARKAKATVCVEPAVEWLLCDARNAVARNAERGGCRARVWNVDDACV